MATTVRASSRNQAASGTAVSVSAPTGTATGDVVICIVCCNGVTTIVDNNGSTSFTEDLNDESEATAGITLSIFSRRIVGGDPSTYNFTIGASGRWTCVAIAFQNPDGSTIYDVTPAVGDKTAAVAFGVAPTITTSTDNSLHVCLVGVDGDTNVVTGTPAGYTVEQNGGNETIAVAYKVITPAGATGTQQFDFTTVNGVIPVSFAIENNPAAGGGGSILPLVAFDMANIGDMGGMRG